MSRGAHELCVYTTLVDEICDDHDYIICHLDTLISAEEISHDEAHEALTTIGAHHIAEEQTLYTQLQPVFPQAMGQSQVYHTVLDDIIHSVASTSTTSEQRRFELSLLRDLLRHHFDTEESEHLTYIAEQLSGHEQNRLGRLYRLKFEAANIELRKACAGSRASKPTHQQS